MVVIKGHIYICLPKYWGLGVGGMMRTNNNNNNARQKYVCSFLWQDIPNISMVTTDKQ